MFSYFKPNFIEKFLWESAFSNFGPKSNWREIKIGSLAAILKRYNFFFELWFSIVHTNVVQISLHISGGKVVFLGGPMEPPPLHWAPTGVKVPWSLKC